MKQDEYFESKDFRDILTQYERERQAGRRIYMDADDLADIAEYYINNKREKEARRVLADAMLLQSDVLPTPGGP